MNDFTQDPDTRVFRIPSNRVWFKKNPRYGTWSVNFDKGGMPAKFQGQHTNFNELYENLNYYLQHRDKWKCEIGEELTGRDIDDAE